VDVSEAEHEMTYFSDRLPVLFTELAAKTYKLLDLEVGLPDNRDLMKNYATTNTTTAANDDDDDDDDDSVVGECDDEGDGADDNINAADDYDEYDNSLCIISDLLNDIESVKTV